MMGETTEVNHNAIAMARMGFIWWRWQWHLEMRFNDTGGAIP
jgi:hypothetical protein